METQYFRFVEVAPETPDYETYLALRYQVFCAELERVKEFKVTTNNRRIETDEFDIHSRHWLAIHQSTGKAAACCRLILPNPEGLSIHRRYEVSNWPFPEAKPESTAEISRMAISPDFRRRQSDQGMPVSGDPNNELPNRPRKELDKRRRHQPELVLGMYREIFIFAGEQELKHAYAAMAPQFIRLLLMAGFPFLKVGPTNPNVEPPRNPYIICREQIIKRLSRKNPALLAFLTGERENLMARPVVTL